MNGAKKELVLFGSDKKRSFINYNSFPSRDEFHIANQRCLNYYDSY
jgi:hypothetical protein